VSTGTIVLGVVVLVAVGINLVLQTALFVAAVVKLSERQRK
jgi:hypothetical protein